MDPVNPIPAIFFPLGNSTSSFPLLWNLNKEAETVFRDISKDHIIVGPCDRGFGRAIFLSPDTHHAQVPGVIGSVFYTLQFLNEQRASVDDLIFFVGEKCYLARPV
jgi:hypothetical protein